MLAYVERISNLRDLKDEVFAYVGLFQNLQELRGDNSNTPCCDPKESRASLLIFSTGEFFACVGRSHTLKDLKDLKDVWLKRNWVLRNTRLPFLNYQETHKNSRPSFLNE